MRCELVIAVLLAATAAAGCSSRQVYEGMRTRQRNECMELDASERERCLEAADVEYDEYERSRERTP